MENGRDLPARSFHSGLADLSKAFATGQSVEIPEKLLSFAKGDTDQNHVTHVAHFFFHLWKRLQKGPGSVNAEALRSAARRSASMDISADVRTAIDYLVLWVEVVQYFAEHELWLTKYSDLATSDTHISGLRERLRCRGTELSTSYGSLMIEGMLASLRNRDTAATLFRAAKAENPDFAAAQLLDQSVNTYFTEGDLSRRASEIEERRADFQQSFEHLQGEIIPHRERTLFLFSCDLAFFAAFFPYWVSAAEYLREQGICMHFVLICDHAEAIAAVERALDVAATVARLRGSAPARHSDGLSFSTAQLPQASSPKTVYASARFLVARQLNAEIEGRIIILDIDMTMRDDPTKILSSLNNIPDRLPVVMTSGMVTLAPARRYLAGKVLLPSGDLGETAMQHIESYIYAGLLNETSWMLDQNALAYAAERVEAAHGPDSIIDVENNLRSFGQAPIRQLYRDSQWRRQESRAR
jgi:tetratricopeptide (TPR) repeat protein